MFYPDQTTLENKLGFDKIRSLLREACISESASSYVDKMKVITDSAQIVKMLDQVNEFKSIIELGERFPSLDYIDFAKELNSIKKEGSWLEEAAVAGVGRALRSFQDIRSFFKTNKGYPQLTDIASAIEFNSDLPGLILDKFGDNNELLDSASPELRRIRKERNKVSQELRNSLARIYKTARESGFIPQNATPAVRDGRMVIPVLAEHKRKVKGFIHDSSSTGHAVFIEPADVLESNNRLKELEYLERAEIVKILMELSSLLREDFEPIKRSFLQARVIDFIRAKAKVAIQLYAVKPVVDQESHFKVLQARHPVLYLNHLEKGEDIVPLDIEFDSTNRILLVSGPNAGGKSVCLKTVGVISYMLQCGMLVPVHGDSEIGVFADIMVDIGDEQSMENDLSTYSSHLGTMKAILQHSGSRTLVLIDEFGTGTDPQYGGAIAEAMLAALTKKGAQGIITTHYNNLKQFAENSEGIQNASMAYDVENLRPLFSLEIGRPGSSYALEVASKIGLESEILESAKSLVGQNQLKIDKLLSELERDKKKYAELLRQVERNRSQSETERERYESLANELEASKSKILSQAKEEAEQILKSTNREIEKTIRHIKENKAEKKETKRIRKSLEKFRDSVEHKKVKKPKVVEAEEFVEGPIGIGDNVYFKDGNVYGEVISIKGKDAKVLVGGLQTLIKLNKLRKVANRKEKGGKKTRSASTGFDYTGKKINFSESVDLRGKRAEEVLPLLDKWIDDALLLGQHSLKILHGKGDGVLRQVVRDYLRGVPEVIEIRSEHTDRGGDGITLVHLK